MKHVVSREKWNKYLRKYINILYETGKMQSIKIKETTLMKPLRVSETND